MNNEEYIKELHAKISDLNEFVAHEQPQRCFTQYALKEDKLGVPQITPKVVELQ